MKNFLKIAAVMVVAFPAAALACGGGDGPFGNEDVSGTGIDFEGRYPDPDTVDLAFALRSNQHASAEWLRERVSMADVMAEHGDELLHRHVIVSEWEGLWPNNRPVSEQSLNILDAMLDGGGDPNAPSIQGLTPLMTLAMRGEQSEMSARQVAVLVRHGADVDQRATGGVTALQVAAQSGAAHIARALLESGANPALRDDDGQSALDIARARGWKDVMIVLTGTQTRADLPMREKK